ncbi:MAG TPA: hypothetical protein VN032_04025 [Thermoanaerobaculia bacterium]|jgi:hypothetical protein|nr:hypothetical protein [Thermoanaerobaculia bacterium]
MTARVLPRVFLALCLVVLGAGSAPGVGLTEDPLALVPADAATVGVIHWSELRSNPLAAPLFAQMDDVSVGGDGARFLRETGLTPREDIDTMVLAMTRVGSGASGASSDGLVIVEGRFDLVRIAGALTARGAVLRKGASAAYYRLPSENDRRDGAVALVNPHLVIAGSEAAVVAALGRRESGGADGLMAGGGLGKSLPRVNRDASAWALVDLTRFPATQHLELHADVHVDEDGGPSRAIVGAMKSMSLLALQATVHGDALDVSATGVTNDAESRDLLEDSLRGLLAMWRLAIQEKSPDLVSVIRRFRVENDADGVSISGTLPGSFLRSLASNRQASKK